MFLPISKVDLEKQNVDKLDFILVIGEAYVDHPSFGHAIISRLIESLGFSVGIISQPQKDADYMIFGEPKHAFLISSGVIDSMVNNYSVNKKKRKKDVYSPGSKPGLRPDMATVVYTKKIKEIYKDAYCIIGSVEASLRKFAHYDYFKDSVIDSILSLSGADLLVYSMGELPITKLCELLKKGVDISSIKHLKGTMYISNDNAYVDKILEKDDTLLLPSFEDVKSDKELYAKMHMAVLENQDDVYGKVLIQKTGDRYIIQNKPERPLTTKELDNVYGLPYERTYHPVYEKTGGIEAIKEVEFSLTSVRGCFGSCNYCALTYHQGRKIQKRSHESIIKEANILVENPNFKGYIHDVGGPTANFREAACSKQKDMGVCKKKMCLSPKPCQNLNTSHEDYISLLRKLRSIDSVKKVFIRSGIRFDYLLEDKNSEFLEELCKYHISGQLKVAPEHSQNSVLEKMGKPNFEVYLKFANKFREMNEKLKSKQYLVPYYISSHPGCTTKDAIKLTEYLKSINYMPEQVQDFYPTPGTVSTCMYYTGLDPRTMKPIYVPRTYEEKKVQRALLQYRKKENYEDIKKALISSGRVDLIGFERDCIIKPKKEEVYLIRNLKERKKEEEKLKKVKSRKRIRNIHKKKIPK